MEATLQSKGRPVIDLRGRRFGRLVATQYLGASRWSCRCDCGAVAVVDGGTLRAGSAQSCGCLRREIAAQNRAAPRPTSTKKTYRKFRNACVKRPHHLFPEYGGQGVRFCDRWLRGDGDLTGFECFLADMGERPGPWFTLALIDPARGFAPGNCKWVQFEEARDAAD